MNTTGKAVLIVAVLALLGLVGAELIRGASKPELPAVQIAGKDLKGQAWSLSDHRGKRPVVVNFFATWCGPCQMEFPELVKMREQYRSRGLELVLFSEEDAATLKQAGLDKAPFPVLPEMKFAFQHFKVQGIPRTLFFDRSGKLAADLEGFDQGGLQRIGEALEAMPVTASR